MKTETQPTTAELNGSKPVSDPLKLKVTLQQVSDFKRHAAAWQYTPEKQTKFTWAVSAMLRRIDKLNPFKEMIEGAEEKDEEINNIRTKYQSVDNDGNLVFADDKMKIRKFTPENEIQASKEINRILKELTKANENFLKGTVEIEPYFAPVESIPSELTFDEIESFKCFVLPPNYEIRL